MDKVIEHLRSNRENYLDELKQFLSIPSVSTDPDNAPIQKCAKWLADHLEQIGFKKVEIFTTPGHPIVYAEWLEAAGKPTVLFYGHYDVQPVDPINLWTTPPFEPTIRDNKIFARGACDDKGQVFINLKAIEAHLKVNGSLPVNIKLLIEGEEEIGSPSLEPFIQKNKDLLKSDLVLISDTSMFADGIPSITYGLRGLCYMEVLVTGPNRDLHSGVYGGAVENPINALASIVAKLKDESGRVTIPGFYDDVLELTPEQREAYSKLPFDQKGYMAELGVAATFGEKDYSILEQSTGRPSLDVNGIWGGFQGEGAKTVLPSKAGAKISMRLVSNQDPEKIAGLFKKYVEKLCPPTMKIEVVELHGADPVIVDINTNAMNAAKIALKKVFGQEPLFTREGGSIPIVATFDKVLNLKSILMGYGLDSDAIHSPNEHFLLKNFDMGVESSAYFFDELAKLG